MENKENNNIDIKEAIEVIKDVGLNIYTPRTTDKGFIKVYLKAIEDILPKLSGNALKVLLALSMELEWDKCEVIVTTERLLRITGLNKDTIRTCLDELEKNLIIKRLGPNVRRSYLVSNKYVRLGKSK